MRRLRLAGFALELLLIVALSTWYIRWCYPYGMRHGYLATMSVALRLYAQDHGGWYPAGAGSPLRSLQLVHWDYMGFPHALAGLSGDVDETIRRVKAGGAIDESVSSWVYWEGFRRDDDPQLAILWERVGGVGFNGRRIEAGAHSVLFADGQMGTVWACDWSEFLAKQEALRTAILDKHRSTLHKGGRAVQGSGANHSIVPNL